MAPGIFCRQVSEPHRAVVRRAREAAVVFGVSV